MLERIQAIRAKQESGRRIAPLPEDCGWIGWIIEAKC
jgi:hypothetical protein